MCDCEDELNMPLLGDPFPDMKVKTTHGLISLPGDFKGDWFVLFSHPADFTPVCTTEFVSFQRHAKQFKELGCKLIGLSIDQVFSHIKWIEWIEEKIGDKISYPVIAANDSIASKIGLLHPGKGTNTVRAVFVVDPDGLVRLIIYYPQEIGRNMDEIVRAVKALKLSDEKKVAVPANWPENELIKDRLIIPPPGDIGTAMKRMDEYDCYDWWFCHKPNN